MFYHQELDPRRWVSQILDAAFANKADSAKARGNGNVVASLDDVRDLKM